MAVKIIEKGSAIVCRYLTNLKILGLNHIAFILGDSS